MAISDLPVVYGGPFADETDALQQEINVAKVEERRPNFSKITANWESISAGTKKWLKEREDFIVVEPEPIVENVVIDYDKQDNFVPAVEDTDTSPNAGLTSAGAYAADDSDIFGGK
jgi:hypothetical protein